MILIKNGHIKTMAGTELENGCVLIGDDGKIAAVGAELTAPAGAQIIDAEGRLVTPGCVDAHSHTGLSTPAIRWEGSEINEKSDPITPQMCAVDGLNPHIDIFPIARRGGVTTVCTGPGSANLIGGTFAAIKTYGNRADEMVLRHPIAMKCALGENPKSAYGQAKKAPYTRMGAAAMMREFLYKAKAYCEDKDAGKSPSYDAKLEAMLPVMRKEIPLKVHAHRADDILTGIRLAKEFGLKMTLDHCTDGAIIAEEIAKEGYPALVGPSFGSRSKPELKSKSYATAGILHKAGVLVSVITDAPVIPQEYLAMCAGLAASAGLPMEEAWKSVTITPATVLGIADRVGSLEAGKDADVVIWTANPLTTIGGRAYITIIDGKIVYQE